MEGKNLIAAKIMHSVKERLGGGYTVSLQEVTKNNDQKLTGLIIRHGEENAVPTIYIDGHICDCSTGVPLEAVTDKIIQAYHGSLPQGFDAESFRDFNWVKGRIIYQMINTSLNRELLKDVPSVPVMDLSLVFKVIVDTFDGAMATVLIRNSHLEELWGVGAETVYGLAKENTPRLLPAKIAGLSDIFKDSGIPIDGDDLVDSLAPMYVLTNQRMLYGGCCICYPGVVSGFAEKMGADLYILPSSVHETLLLPDLHGSLDPSNLREMVHEVNRSEVSWEERLSDSVYFYSRETGEISQAL